MNFKFGRYVHRVHANKSPLKFGRKGSVGVSRDCPNFFEYPLLSQERVKLRSSNLAGIFTGSIQTKPHQKILGKRSVGVSRDCRNLFSTPYYLRNG